MVFRTFREAQEASVPGDTIHEGQNGFGITSPRPFAPTLDSSIPVASPVRAASRVTRQPAATPSYAPDLSLPTMTRSQRRQQDYDDAMAEGRTPARYLRALHALKIIK